MINIWSKKISRKVFIRFIKKQKLTKQLFKMLQDWVYAEEYFGKEWKEVTNDELTKILNNPNKFWYAKNALYELLVQEDLKKILEAEHLLFGWEIIGKEEMRKLINNLHN